MEITSKQAKVLIGREEYRNLRRLKNILRDVSWTQRFSDSIPDALDKALIESLIRLHLNKEEHRFVKILWASLSYADRFQYFRSELRFEDVINLGGSEADA